VVWAVPHFVMWRLAKSVPAAMRGAGAAHFPPMTDHTARRVVMPSPDLLYALCEIDLRERPMRVRADPKAPHYWSIALYADNSDNFFVVNDRQAAGAPVDLLLVAPGAAAPADAAGVRVVHSPSRRGLLLMRVLVSDYAREQAVVEAARRTLRCDPA
jgi:uncharacterized membrane protein